MISDEGNEVMEERFDSPKNRYQNKLETKTRIVSLTLIMFIYCIINAIL